MARLLILGGTSFLGPALVAAARARGHEVTLFNRGTRPPPGEVEVLRGERDPRKGEGLERLAGRAWDAAIDTCGYYPRIVKAGAELLAPSVGRYVFISSVSAYARNDEPGADESAPLGTLADPAVEEMGQSWENYGPLKALCEEAAEAALPGRVAIVRPGFIVGPGDPSDRFTYWPVRMEEGGDVLVPGDASDPVQVIDVRDLAGWLVLLVERRAAGVWNATGERVSWGEVVDACHAVTGRRARLEWFPWSRLEQGEGFPICIPPTGDTSGFHLRSVAKARSDGLVTRPLGVTISETLAWARASGRKLGGLRAGPTPERERELLVRVRS
jgi:2'-hydroxyisoflavone reductase